MMANTQTLSEFIAAHVIIRAASGCVNALRLGAGDAVFAFYPTARLRASESEGVWRR
jgi:hypothetical protein